VLFDVFLISYRRLAKMNKISMIPHSRLSAMALIYGAYSVLCHATAVLFDFLLYRKVLPEYILMRRTVPFLEHTLMSLALIVIGAFLIDYTLAQQKK
jgi:hypothetical protein